MRHGAVVLVALLAAGLGVGAGLLVSGPGPVWRTELGQRALQVAAETAKPPPEGVPLARKGDPLPGLLLTALSGGQVRLPDAYAGRPLLINFWASWCAPCVKEMPELDRYARTQGANGVQVVGIALDDAASVQAFLARVPVNYPILLDTPGPADSSVQVGNVMSVLPYTVLVSADGRILRQRSGLFDPGELEGFARPAGD